jgi:hypothetical protein
MRNLFEVLREKEMDLVRVRHEVEALRFVAPLLFEQSDPSWSATPPKNRWPLELNEPAQLSAEL